MSPHWQIPVESKLSFECPSAHVKALQSFIPEVRKILVIGWRATELPFLELLKEGLGAATPWIKIINGRQSYFAKALENILKAGIRVRDVGVGTTESTFTEFLNTRGQDKFLILQ